MRFPILFGMAVLVSLYSQVHVKGQQQEDVIGIAELVGTYQIVGEEKNGQVASSEHAKHVTVLIGTNAITTYDKDKKEVFAANYSIDTSNKPWQITMIATLTPTGAKGTQAKGLIEVDGDSVKLIYGIADNPPTEFKTRDKQIMFTLKKVTAKPNLQE